MSDVHGQGGPPGPEVIGQWQGPYATTVDQSGQYAYPKTREIAHMALLPPSHESPAVRRVLLTCLTGHGCFPSCGALNTTGQRYGRASFITLAAPTRAVAIPPPAGIPQHPNNGAGSQDFFCGGHTFAPDGSLIWAGGSDYEAKCLDCNSGAFWGHPFAYRLDTSTEIPSWTAAGMMSLARWYPTLLSYGTPAKIGAFGHTAKPIADAEDFREELDFGSLTWNSQPIPNLVQDVSCVDATTFRIHDYPRMHVLRCRLLLHGNPMVAWADKPNEWKGIAARFLDIADPECLDEPRWHLGLGNGQNPIVPEVMRLHGSSVQIIAWDGEDFTEVIYAVGGSITEVGGNPCDCYPTPKSWQSESIYLKSVEKLIASDDPDVTIEFSGWDPSPPDMWYSRANHNTVITLDGRFIVIGGTSFENGVCVSRRVVEAYAPPEIFGDPFAEWEPWAEQGVERGYHSGAVLEPGGKIISGGGRAKPHSEDPAVDEDCLPTVLDEDWQASAHSVEIFSPPYMFVPRPVIDPALLNDPATTPYDYGELLIFDVELAQAEDTIARVALVRNGASTHGFDSDQRYVQLRVDDILTPDPEHPRIRRVRVFLPPNPYWAPQGAYMLTVVDQNQIPSEAEWIRLVVESEGQ